MQIGYASGYTSAFWRAASSRLLKSRLPPGRSQCRIVGKLVEEWFDAHELTPITRPTPSSTACSNCVRASGRLRALHREQPAAPEPHRLIPGFPRAYSSIDPAVPRSPSHSKEIGVGTSAPVLPYIDMSRRPPTSVAVQPRCAAGRADRVRTSASRKALFHRRPRPRMGSSSGPKAAPSSPTKSARPRYRPRPSCSGAPGGKPHPATSGSVRSTCALSPPPTKRDLQAAVKAGSLE